MTQKLPITQEQIKAFLKIATHDGVRKFAIDLLRIVAVAVALPAESSTTDEASARPEPAEIDDDGESESNFAEGQDLHDDSLKNKPPVAGNFIEWQMKGATFASYTDEVGLLVSANRILNLPLLDVPLSRSFMRLSIAVPRASFSQTALD